MQNSSAQDVQNSSAQRVVLVLFRLETPTLPSIESRASACRVSAHLSPSAMSVSALDGLSAGKKLLRSISVAANEEIDLKFLCAQVSALCTDGALHPTNISVVDDQVMFSREYIIRLETAMASAQRLCTLDVSDSVYDGEVERLIWEVSQFASPICFHTIGRGTRLGMACGDPPTAFTSSGGGWRCQAHSSGHTMSLYDILWAYVENFPEVPFFGSGTGMRAVNLDGGARGHKNDQLTCALCPRPPC